MLDIDCEVSGLGIGFIIFEDGQIVINVYVIDGVIEVEVMLFDGCRFEGIVLGVDMVIDLVVIQIIGVDNLLVL